MEWSIADLARIAGTTSRTLRHYGEVGLLPPSRTGNSGLRFYDQQALVRLQRILLLRDLGLGLPAIGQVLAGQRDTTSALHTHLALLEQEKSRIERQIASVRTTLLKTEGGEQLMAEEVFDGFDHTRHKAEVIERWGREAYDKSAGWWRGLTEDRKREFMAAHGQIAIDYAAARDSGLSAESAEVEAIAARHVAWLSGPVTVSREYVAGIGEMYVADDRFRANYDQHGPEMAEFVRDALKSYAQRRM